MQGYAIGSYLYLGIVFSLPMVCKLPFGLTVIPPLLARARAASMGVRQGIALGGLALDLPISLDEVYNDLVLPASASVIMGKAGTVLIVSVSLSCFEHSTASVGAVSDGQPQK